MGCFCRGVVLAQGCSGGADKKKAQAGQLLGLFCLAETVSAGNVIQQSPFMNMDGS